MRVRAASAGGGRRARCPASTSDGSFRSSSGSSGSTSEPSGGRLPTSSPPAPSSSGSFLGRAGLGAVGRGGGCFFSSLPGWGRGGERGCRHQQAPCGCCSPPHRQPREPEPRAPGSTQRCFPTSPGGPVAPTSPGSAAGWPQRPGRRPAPSPAAWQLWPPGQCKSPSPPAISSSGPHRLHRRPPRSERSCSTCRQGEGLSGAVTPGQNWVSLTWGAHQHPPGMDTQPPAAGHDKGDTREASSDPTPVPGVGEGCFGTPRPHRDTLSPMPWPRTPLTCAPPRPGPCARPRT